MEEKKPTQRSLAKPKLLNFELNDEIKDNIEKAISEFIENSEKFEFTCQIFEEYGKSLLYDHKFHPEAYFQVGCIII